MSAGPVQLFCFPYAGASARSYAPWSRRLPPSVEVCPVELPGRGDRIREPPCDRLEPLVHELTASVARRRARRFALFGHSLGALLAFEVGRRLTAGHGLRPVRLFASGHRAPHLPLREQRIKHLPDDRFLARLCELGGTPEEVFDSPELVRILLPMMRADFTIAEDYRPLPGPPLDCPVTALGGLDDPDVGTAELGAWREHTAARCRVRMFPGGHFFLHSAESVLLDVLAAELLPRTTTGHHVPSERTRPT